MREVTRSAYDRYRAGKKVEPAAAAQKKAEQVQEVGLANKRRYGVRRVSEELRKQGAESGRYLVRRLMKEQRLRAIQPRRYVPKTTNSDHQWASPNLLKEVENQATEPKTVIIGDITELPMANGRFCYLASWQDKYTRRISGWKVDQTMTEEQVIAALRKALNSGRMAKNAILQTDRGSQYSSKNFRQLWKENNVRQALSAKGNCYDNAPAESFFARYKQELMENGKFENLAQASSETFSYIEGYYNRQRLHSGLGYQSPEQFEQNYHQNLTKGEPAKRFVSSFT